MRRRSVLVILILHTLFSVAQRSVFSDPKPVTLHFIVTLNDSMTKAEHVTLELMDAVGSSGVFDRRDTGNDGVVIFNTFSGLHRFRISGSNIQTYEGQVELTPYERVHYERVVVRGKPSDTASTDVSTTSGVVPAIRLKIPSDAKKAFEKGTEEMKKGKWNASRKQFETAIRLYPNYDMAYDGLGVVEVQLQETEKARQSFLKALELNPDFAGANRNLARLLIAQNNYSEALKFLTKSLETEPDDAWALTYAAYAELQAKQFETALTHSRKVHALSHNGLANAHVIAALALESLDRRQEAISEWNLYLAEDPNGPSAVRARKSVAWIESQQ